MLKIFVNAGKNEYTIFEDKEIDQIENFRNRIKKEGFIILWDSKASTKTSTKSKKDYKLKINPDRIWVEVNI